MTCTGALKEIEYTVHITPKADDDIDPHLAIDRITARVVIEDIVQSPANTGSKIHV